MKNKTEYVCTECGNVTAKWFGKCPGCGEWNTLEEEVIADKTTSLQKVEKLIDNVIAAGITYFAITDHDTAKGCRKVLDSEELKQKISAANISFVCGIEFSCIYKG